MRALKKQQRLVKDVMATEKVLIRAQEDTLSVLSARDQAKRRKKQQHMSKEMAEFQKEEREQLLAMRRLYGCAPLDLSRHWLPTARTNTFRFLTISTLTTIITER